MNYPQQGYQPVPQPQFQQPTYQPQPQFPAYTQPYQAPQGQPGPRPQAAPQAQAPAPVRGTLASGWDQGARSGGYGAWVKFPVEGHIFEGFVARDMTDPDCTQVIDPGTKQPKFFKSGGAQLRFLITFNVQPSPEYPEGKATLTTDKYKLHSAVVQAMQLGGFQPGEGLREGDHVRVQRIGDVSVGMGRAHEFIAQVTRREDLGGAPAPVQQASAPAPAQVSAYQQATGSPAPVEQVAQFGEQPVYGQQAPAPFQVAPAAPAQTATPVAPTGGLTAAGNPLIPGLDEVQSDLVARYGAGQPQG
jgi:hypothetical protein